MPSTLTDVHDDDIDSADDGDDDADYDDIFFLQSPAHWLVVAHAHPTFQKWQDCGFCKALLLPTHRKERTFPEDFCKSKLIAMGQSNCFIIMYCLWFVKSIFFQAQKYYTSKPRSDECDCSQ